MNDTFRISPDGKRADALKSRAKERLSDIKDNLKPYKLIEEYYEIIKELITSIMYKRGYKTLSHVELVEFASKEIKELSKKDIMLIDELRIKRNGIMYYGEEVTSEFVKTREESIKTIINRLFKI
jgi:hypothetical protein